MSQEKTMITKKEAQEFLRSRDEWLVKDINKFTVQMAETIISLHDLLRDQKQEADQNWRAAVGAMDESDRLYRESLNREY